MAELNFQLNRVVQHDTCRPYPLLFFTGTRPNLSKVHVDLIYLQRIKFHLRELLKLNWRTLTRPIIKSRQLEGVAFGLRTFLRVRLSRLESFRFSTIKVCSSYSASASLYSANYPTSILMCFIIAVLCHFASVHVVVLHDCSTAPFLCCPQYSASLSP